MLALLSVVGCGPAKKTTPTASEAAPTNSTAKAVKATWECGYIDGSGNDFHFYKQDGAIHFRYKPIQPLQSSSGVYSGGTAKTGILSPEQAKTLETQLNFWKEKKDSHVTRRSKGVGSFRLVNGEQSRYFLVPESQMTELNALLKPLRP